MTLKIHQLELGKNENEMMELSGADTVQEAPYLLVEAEVADTKIVMTYPQNTGHYGLYTSNVYFRRSNGLVDVYQKNRAASWLPEFLKDLFMMVDEELLVRIGFDRIED